MASITTKDSRAQMATVRPGVMKRLPRDPSRTGSVVREAIEVDPNDLCMDIIRTEYAAHDVDFSADVIISGGKGLQNRDSYESLIGSLREAVAGKLGTRVEVGASRSAVEQGFTGRSHQVGQTGTSVGPKLYLALGISGAIQHMIGVANTETIIAVNNDPNAPIFKQCDYYIIGDVEKVVPELSASLGGV